MGRNIDLEWRVNPEDLKMVMDQLNKCEKDVRKVLRNAVNRAASEARTVLIDGVQEAYAIKRSKGKASLTMIRASYATLTAILKSQGSPESTAHFRYSMPKAGAKAAVLKSGNLKPIKGKADAGAAFMINGAIMQRRDSKRTPIRKAFSPSMPTMIKQVYGGKRGVKGALDPVISRRLYDECLIEIGKLI